MCLAVAGSIPVQMTGSSLRCLPSENLQSYVPVPLRPTCCGLLRALSVMVSVPLSGPMRVGVYTTLIVQEALTATLEPQLLVCEKSPLAAMLPIVSPAAPVLVRVTLCEALEVPTG